MTHPTPNTAAGALERPRAEDQDKRDFAPDPFTVFLWITAGGLILGGAALTALSLVLPADASLLLARVVAAASGVLLTSLGGVVASYLGTKATATRDIQTQHVRFLIGTARNLATIYHALQDATAKRRNGAYSHEETYQETVLLSSNSILGEYESITSLSGRIQGAFRDSRSDIEEMRPSLSTDSLLQATTLAAKRAAAPLQAPEPVTVTCPACSSRVLAHLTLRAGWTASATCSHCATSFLIHRRSDLTVYVGRINRLGAAVQVVPAEVVPLPVAPELAVVEPPLVQAADAFVVACPSCGAKMAINAFRLSSDDVTRRICTQCAQKIEVSITGRNITRSQAGKFVEAPVVGRRTAYAKVACDVDGKELNATYLRRSDGAWVAVCPVHLHAFVVQRHDFRAWLAANDPVYMAARLEHEATGGVTIIGDYVADDAGPAEAS